MELLVKAQPVDQQRAKVLVNGDTPQQLDYVTLASMTEGYTAADLKDLVGSALQQAVIRCAQSDEEVRVVDGSRLTLTSDYNYVGRLLSGPSGFHAIEPSRCQLAEVGCEVGGYRR